MDFIGIGAARCSTTWIYKCLDEHPEVCLPKKKELHFFDNDLKYKRGIQYYMSQVSCIKSYKIKGEITPRYILYKECLKRIKFHFPNIKIIISLRDPVKRTISQYKYFRYNKKKEPEKNIIKALESNFYEDYINKSFYYKQIKEVFSIFDNHSILIVFDDSINYYPQNTIKKIYNFLGVDTYYIPKIVSEKINSSYEKLYNDPPVFWAKINQIQKQNVRFINEIQYGYNSGNKILKILLKNKKSISFVAFINNLLDRYLSCNKELEISESDKLYIYKNYFEKDILQLEKFLNKDLSNWKIGNNNVDLKG